MPESSVSYICPNCGAPLTFMPGKNTVTCQFCNTEFEVAKLEEIFQEKNNRASTWMGDELNLQAFTCSSCGAELICDENTMATECVYCGNPVMIPKRFDGMLKPNFVIPFKKTKEDAVATLKKFYEGKRLLPKDFIANNRVEAIQPMYVPFWLFDAKVSANILYNGIKIYEPRKSNVKDKKYFKCKRTGTMEFEKVPADGSKKMNDDYMDSIEPFDYKDLKPFSAAYFAGFLADKYDVDAEDCKARVVERIDNSTIDRLKETVKGYDEINIETAEIKKDFHNISYVMVPVWILTTRYKEKPYTFMMNGQTGKFIGILPKSLLKSILYPTLLTLALLPIFYFILLFFTED